jgi:hypothetical protein
VSEIVRTFHLHSIALIYGVSWLFIIPKYDRIDGLTICCVSRLFLDFGSTPEGRFLFRLFNFCLKSLFSLFSVVFYTFHAVYM